MIRSTSSIDDLNLSTRPRNALHHAGINTVGDLLRLNEEEILNIRNLGKKSAEELLHVIPELQKQINNNNLLSKGSTPDEWIAQEAGKQFIVSYLRKNGKTIDELDALSSRTYNHLLLCDCEELDKIIFLSEEELLKFPKMDKETAKETVINTQYYLRKNMNVFFALYQNEAAAETDASVRMTIQDYIKDPEQRENILQFVKANDVSIKDMKLNVRAFNCLDRAGIRYISEIIFMSALELKAIPSMGSLSVSLTQNNCKEYLEKNQERIIAYCNGDKTVYYTDEVICSSILSLYKEKGFAGFSFREIFEGTGLAGAVDEERIKKIIGTMIADHRLEYVDYRCYRVYPKFREYFDSYQDIKERNKDFIDLRLQGCTLEEIASKYDVTRERVRQIIVKEYEQIKQAYSSGTGAKFFDEDYYRYFLETYDVPKTDCEPWLGIPTETFHFINLPGRNRGKEQLESALEDPRLDTGLRIKIEKYLNKDVLLINDTYVKKSRSSIEDFLIPILCRETIPFSEFVAKYNQTLEENKVPFDSDIYYTDEVIRTRINRLVNSKIVLWAQNKKMRYYDIEARDYTELLDTINLDAYENTEISTGRFIEYYPEIMDKYDIHDRFELHNLLRKIVTEGSFHDFRCSRMPNLQFGTFDREAAFFDMMVENAPISNKDLAQLIHDEYGYEIATTMASPEMSKLSPYFHKGIYSIDQKELPRERTEELLSALTEDFYYIDEVRTIYQNMFSDAKADEINPYSLKGMGFLVYSKVVLRNYAGLEQYYKHLLLSEDVLDVTEYKKKFTFTSQFSDVLNDLKKEHTIFEFEPNQFIHIRRLEKAGYSREDIESFLEDAYDYATDRSYFNSHSLRETGFKHPLYDLGFEDTFYTNLLCTDPRYSFTRIFNSAVLYKGTKELTIKSFLQDLISEQRSMDIYDLESDLRDIYGVLPPDKSTLVYKLENTPVYYDRILERFYKNKSLYYQELDESEEMRYAG